LEPVEYFTVDLTQIEGNGDFTCPKCRAPISPDDITENTYTITETVMSEDSLEKIILTCNECRSHIKLVGFEILARGDNLTNNRR